MNRTGKKVSIWRMIYPLLVFFGVDLLVTMIVSSVLTMELIAQSGPAVITDPDFQKQIMEKLVPVVYQNANLINLIKSIPSIGLMLLFMHMDKKRLYRNGEYVTYERPAAIFFAAAGLLGVFAGITGNNIIGISGLAELYAETEEMLAQITYSGGLLLEILSVVILAPIAEELVFRGLIFRRMREFAPFAVSMIFSALIFGFYHGNVVQGVYAFLVGLLCAYVCEKFKSILAPILLHMCANGFSVLATESGLLEKYITTNTAYIAYIVICAAATVLLMWQINEKVKPEVLIPARNDTAGEEESADA